MQSFLDVEQSPGDSPTEGGWLGGCVERTLLSAAFDLAVEVDFDFDSGAVWCRRGLAHSGATTPACVERTLLSAAFDLAVEVDLDLDSGAVCRFVSFSSGGFSVGEGFSLPRPRIQLVHGRFRSNTLVTHVQHSQVFCPARQLQDYAVPRCRVHQRAPQRGHPTDVVAVEI